MNQKAILTSYIATSLWSSTDSEDGNLDDNYSEEDIDIETIEKMKVDIAQFVIDAKDPIIESGMSESDLGHNLWLTRNGHGTGFWDRGLEKSISDAFCDACNKLGSCSLYVGDDGKIHQE